MQSDQVLNPTSNLPEGICRQFSIDEILTATKDFDDSLVLGQGGFATVYRGEIDNGTLTVAIKKSKSMSPELRKEFRDEILMVSKFRHSHLVSLIGYCETDNEMILVYEYMDGGTLEENLHKLTNDRVPLCWVERLKISICVARGLDYLHTGTGINNKVIHRDIKSSNILLDQNRAVAKISDFGFSKIGPANQADSRVMTRVIGTYGYMDPDYYQTGELTSKSDVYAFGVVLLELLCGRVALDKTLDQDQWNLAAWVRLCIKKGKVAQIIDPNLKSEMMPRSLSAFVKIANRCLNERPKDRPTMMEVLVELVHALSLQKTGKQNGSKMTEKLFEFFSVKPRPISGNDTAVHATEAAATDQNDQLVEETKAILVAPVQLDLDELKEITNNFSENALIGEESNAKVYSGTFRSGAFTAIKKFDLPTNMSEQEFFAQVALSL
jgi:serine/threonine protein kinase